MSWWLHRARPRAKSCSGHGRAFDAIVMAVGIGGPGYNVFVSGARSREERESIMKLLAEKAATMPTPGRLGLRPQLPHSRGALRALFETGRGSEAARWMNELIHSIIEQLPKAFRREDFDQERTRYATNTTSARQELFGGLEQKAREKGFAIQTTPNSQVIFLPLIEGKMPESPEALTSRCRRRPTPEREQLGKGQVELQEEFGSVVLKQQELMRELIDDIRTIERSFAARLAIR